jgi:hypothetical protein
MQNSNFTCCFVYETWYLTRSEEHRFGECENRVLRKKFGPKEEEEEVAEG